MSQGLEPTLSLRHQKDTFALATVPKEGICLSLHRSPSDRNSQWVGGASAESPPGGAPIKRNNYILEPR